jgi:phage terminase large subunit-like protein
MTPDALTLSWLRNPSDEKAAANGCRFDVDRGIFTVNWIESLCKLYEGEWAGQPLILRGCLDCAYDLEGIDAHERATRHVECVKEGHHVSWQYDCTMRLFSWVRWSERWQRNVRRFRQACIFISKKNGKTPTLAAWGLYLLAGDGEQGQKVFLAAKDGSQARELAGKHVVEMLLSSPELMAECTLNRSLMQVTHEETRSILRPLSSSNSRTQESKEGLNGSIMVDEVHVVDADFMSRISRAGISRSEPLQIEVSTAGNNPDGYGKQRFDRACEIEKGTFEDQDTFVAVYAAPQTLSDADLDADPLKYGRLANPAMGHTVDPEEYLKDYANSKASGLQALLDFKMYRLNIWQHSSNPWLAAGDWQRCEEAFTLADLEGETCWAGLDLSRTQDMSSLVLVFKHGESYRLLPYFWLPEEVARDRNSQVPFLSWARSGFLDLTPGNVIDYTFIRSRFRDLAKRFKIQTLAYDPHYAEETTQTLEQGAMDAVGQVIEEATGVRRVPFLQSLMNFTKPTKDFERLVIAGKLHHNGHPILTWQAGHVQVKSDANQNIRPVKPPRQDMKKIDGIVAGIMALSEAMKGQGEVSGRWYETHEVEFG